MHFKPLGQKLPDNITLFGRNLKYGAEAQRRSCSAIDKEYAVGTFTGRVFHIGGLKPNKPPVLPGEINTLVYEKITSDDSMVVVWRPHY